MFRFGNLEMSGQGPFDLGQALQFSDGLTIISGKSATGKTTIENCLRSEYDRFCARIGSRPAPSWIIFFAEYLYKLPYGGVPWEPLATFIASNPSLLSRRQQIDQNLTNAVRQLLRQKLDYYKSTVASKPKATLNDEGAVLLFGDNGESMDFAFTAFGERIVLLLAINALIREFLELDVPLVVDEALDGLDDQLSKSCFEFMKNLSGQTIILASARSVEALDVASDFILDLDPETQASKITKNPNRN